MNKEELLDHVTTVSASYKPISDLKRKINEEITQAISAINEKYKDELQTLVENHEMMMMLQGKK